VEYAKQVLDKEGIPYQVFAGDASRANLVTRIKGNGKKKPITEPSARIWPAATSTAAAPSTTRTIWSPA
jgi:hypothetical protein